LKNTASVRLSDLVTHGARGVGTSLSAGRGIIIGQLSAGETPEEPWEAIYSGVRHSATTEQYRSFEEGVERVTTLFDLTLLVRTHLRLADPMPEPSESTFVVWMTKWANHIVQERTARLHELSKGLTTLTESIAK